MHIMYNRDSNGKKCLQSSVQTIMFDQFLRLLYLFIIIKRDVN